MPTFRAFHPWHLSSNACRSARGLVLVSLLISGLLNFPSTCQCGAELPHPHSLFLLADHHHSPDGQLEAPKQLYAGYAGVNSPQTENAGPGPVVQGAVPEGVAGDEISFAFSGQVRQAWPPLRTFAIWQLVLPRPANAEPPDHPPPRA